MPNRIIEDVTLVHIDPKNGAQKYTWPGGVTNVIYLSGRNMASNVKVGDKGKLEYRTGGSYGLFFFVKEQ